MRTRLITAATSLVALAGLACDDPAPSAPAAPQAVGPASTASDAPPRRLHWFLPDGMRADPEVFDVFRWADEGKLPNLKKLMDRGTYGYSIPTFPSHTPTNFATLMTGAPPEVHGIADGPMRTAGNPLARPSVGGFSSSARRVPAAWSLLEDSGRKVVVMSMPGSTPPELDNGVTVRGRWGGWGADFPALLFEHDDAARKKDLGRLSRLFMLSTELTRFVETRPPTPVSRLPNGTLPRFEATLDVYGASLRVVGLDTDADSSPDKLAFLDDSGQHLATLAQGEWSDWHAASVDWKALDIPTSIRLHVVRLAGDDDFRVRVLVDTLNDTVTQPSEEAAALRADAGPMVDFVDNFPAQLIHYNEDKQTFLDEARQSWEWHARAVKSVYARHQPGAVFHNIYTPNQMLTSRWWMGFVDPASSRYAEVDDATRQQLWSEVHSMYQGLDTILGEAMAGAGDDALVVLSSDHGAAPMDQVVRLNDFFAQKGWLARKTDPTTGGQVVDWDRSQVVFLQMYSVYINPEGLGGTWNRASGPAYEALRDEVSAALLSLRDDDGKAPVASVLDWEQADQRFLPPDRVGDLIVANHPGYGWSEETTAQQAVFSVPRATGYKQSIEPASTKAVWTPFVIAGPGIRKNHRLAEPIRHIDQLPTILTALGEPVPEHATGTVQASVLATP